MNSKMVYLIEKTNMTSVSIIVKYQPVVLKTKQAMHILKQV